MSLFNPTAEETAMVNELAKAFTPIEEIAALMGFDEDQLREALRSKASPLRDAYMRGKAESALAIRKAEVNMAVNGSPMAIQHANQYLTDMTNNEIE